MKSSFPVAWLITVVLLASCATDRDSGDDMSSALPATSPSATAAPATAPTPATPAPTTPAGGFDSGLDAHAGLRFDCAQDSDCAIVDVGNCCGHYPACVNGDSQVDPAAVARECAESQMAGICGFPVINACVCSAGRCEAASDSRGETFE